MVRTGGRLLATGFVAGLLAAAVPAAQVVVTPAVAPLVTVQEPVVALERVRVVDGTGTPPREDQTILIENGRITAVGSRGRVRVPGGARRLDLAGHTVIPGLVGLHEHLYYAYGPDGATSGHPFSFPRLYLAGGVTTARTAGGFDIERDLDVARDIELGLAPGPRMLVTAGYLEGLPLASARMTRVTNADEARAFVSYWAERGVHSIKAYTHIPRAALAAAIDEAHRRGLTVTGHLCSVTFRDAAELGIDNLEHGFVVASDWVTGKRADACPAGQAAAFAQLEADDPRVDALIRLLVARKVAMTSTLAVMELPVVQPRYQDALAPEVFRAFLSWRTTTHGQGRVLFADAQKEVQLERRFVRAGGLLVAGADPTGDGQVLPGFGNQRNIELLVEGGFSPLEAIRVATLNGAEFLGMADRVGSIAVGKQADLVVIEGNPVARIEDIERVRTVFVAGVGFDSARLLASVKGQVGRR
jgi:imidazolonepropionase-like amidohydrolase